MRPILILGASGFIGNTLYKELAPYYKTDGSYNSSQNFKNNSMFIPLNHKKDNLKEIFNDLNPKLIISSMRGDFNSQIEAHIHIINYVKSNNCRIMFISSANVFDSFLHYPSYEYDKTLSGSVYGHFKIKIENLILQLPVGKHNIVRLPMIFGINSPRTLELDRAVNKNKTIEVFPNTIINVNSDVRLSQQIHYIINQKKTGIFHLGSTDLISHYDFIKTLLIRRHKKSGILKQVYTSNKIRYLATLPKENKLPNHIQPSYIDILDDLSIS